jgi:hypothetical protein
MATALTATAVEKAKANPHSRRERWFAGGFLPHRAADRLQVMGGSLPARHEVTQAHAWPLSCARIEGSTRASKEGATARA